MKFRCFAWCPHCQTDMDDDCEITTWWIFATSFKFHLRHNKCKQLFQIDMPIESFMTIKEGVHIDMQKRQIGDHLR